MHTGQHLVSAICDNTLSLPTLSWSMPPHPSTEPCYIELPRGLTPLEASSVEQAVNELVMTRGQRSVDDDGVKVWIESRLQGPSGTATPAESVVGTTNDVKERLGQGMGETGEEKREGEWGDRESRGLPKDYADGVIRTAVIDGIDRSCECVVVIRKGWTVDGGEADVGSSVSSSWQYVVEHSEFPEFTSQTIYHVTEYLLLVSPTATRPSPAYKSST
jgi:hypothetical protein